MNKLEDENLNNASLAIATIRSGSLDERRLSVRQLAETGVCILPQVVSALNSSESDDERWYLASVLARIREPLPLIKIIQETKDPAVRKYISAALGEMGPDAVNPLITLFHSDDPELRGFASLALCRIGIPAITALKNLLNDNDPLISSCSMMTLLRMGEAGIDIAVKEGIDSPD